MRLWENGASGRARGGANAAETVAGRVDDPYRVASRGVRPVCALEPVQTSGRHELTRDELQVLERISDPVARDVYRATLELGVNPAGLTLTAEEKLRRGHRL